MNTSMALHVEPLYAVNGEFIGALISPSVAGVTKVSATLNSRLSDVNTFEYQSTGAPIAMTIWGDESYFTIYAAATVSGTSYAITTFQIPHIKQQLGNKLDNTIFKLAYNNTAIRVTP
jgi:hypothetical protein